MVLVIDNYDSFTYNLVQYIMQLGKEVQVVRNDAMTVEQVSELDFEQIVISPGPGTPGDAGISMDVIREFAGKKPILGVCLGLQTIGQVFGGTVSRAPLPMHGKVSEVEHSGQAVFRGINGPFKATRYHSLVVKRDTMPAALQVTAETDDGLVMGLAHRTLPLHGVQFHPESIASEHGHLILKNFLDLAAAWNGAQRRLH